MRDRVHELLADARVGEEVLDDDDAADQVLDVLREDLDARRERVAQRVAPDDAPLAEAVQPRHLDVVRPQHLDHAGPHHADRRRERHAEQRQHRQHEHVRLRERARPGRDERDRRQHVEPGEEDEDQQRADHELRQRDDREGANEIAWSVGRPARSAGDHAEHERERDHEQRRDRRRGRASCAILPLDLVPDRQLPALARSRPRVAEVAL